MTTRLGFLVSASALAAACTVDKAADDATAAASTAQAAIDKLHVDYTTHFNMHHASVVGDLYSDSAGFFGADGSIDIGKPAIVKGLEETMGLSPTLTLSPAETKVFGDHALTRGSYTVAATPPGGAAINQSGNYLTHFVRENGIWKIGAVVTNYDATPPAGLPRDTTTQEAPPDAGTLTDLVAAYTQHFNQGHASVVAGLYTDSAYAAFADAPARQGRPAIEAALTENMAQGSPQVTIHAVATTELPDGWAIDGGWYQVKATTPNGAVTQTGVYMLLARRQADQSWKIHWLTSNGGSSPAS
jgi:ketosteroid isomerase-like protein